MSLAAAYSVGPVSVNGTVISSIISSEATDGVSYTNPILTGNGYPGFSAVTGIKQGGVFSSHALYQVINATGAIGVAISSTTGLYFKKRAVGGLASGSVHRSYLVSSGVVIPTSLSCTHQGEAVINCAIVAISADGTTSGIAVANNSAMPSETSAAMDDVWTLYDAKIGNVTFTGLTGVDIDFGNSVRTVGSNSEKFDTAVGMRSMSPTITLRGLDNTLVTTALAQSSTGTHANSNIRFFKRGSVAADAVHIILTMNGSWCFETLASASGDGEATCNARMVASFDGSDLPIVWSQDEIT